MRWAVRGKDEKKAIVVVDYLLRKKANVNEVDGTHSNTALIEAISLNKPELAKHLIRVMNRNMLGHKNKKGKSAMDYAQVRNAREVITKLRERGVTSPVFAAAAAATRGATETAKINLKQQLQQRRHHQEGVFYCAR